MEIKGKFEGYLWKSDQQKPEIYEIYEGKEPTSLTLNDGENPFIIEGQLYDSSEGHSVSIKYVDGKYIVHEYNINNDFKGEVSLHHFQGHKMNGKNLHFVELWEEKADPLCDNMGVLQATKVAFIGFE